MKNVLIATDFSEKAKQAAFFGYELAKNLNARVILCTAITIPIVAPKTGMELWPMEPQTEITDDSELALKRLKNDLEREDYTHTHQPKVECLLKVGSLDDIIRDINEQQKLDLLVMGTHEGGAFSRFLLGDHSRDIINDGGIPVLLVPKGNSFKNIKKIAFAAELKRLEKDLDSIFKLITIAQPLHAEILLVHVQRKNQELVAHEKAFAKFITELSNKSGYPLIYYRILKNKSVDEGLDWLCKHGQVDMLAMVHGKHSFLHHLLNKSHTIKMAMHTKVPLLVFPD